MYIEQSAAQVYFKWLTKMFPVRPIYSTQIESVIQIYSITFWPKVMRLDS